MLSTSEKRICYKRVSIGFRVDATLIIVAILSTMLNLVKKGIQDNFRRINISFTEIPLTLITTFFLLILDNLHIRNRNAFQNTLAFL